MALSARPHAARDRPSITCGNSPRLRQAQLCRRMAKSSGSTLTAIVRRSRPFEPWFCDHDPGVSQGREALVGTDQPTAAMPRPTEPRGTNSQRGVVAVLRGHRHGCSIGPRKPPLAPASAEYSLGAARPGQSFAARRRLSKQCRERHRRTSATCEQRSSPRITSIQDRDHTRTSRPQLVAIGAVFARQATSEPCTSRRKACWDQRAPLPHRDTVLARADGG